MNLINRSFALSSPQVLKLVDNYSLNAINPYSNPEVRFSKKLSDCCEKANINYTENKIKSFINSRFKYQLRAYYPEELENQNLENVENLFNNKEKKPETDEKKNIENSNNIEISNNNLFKNYVIESNNVLKKLSNLAGYSYNSERNDANNVISEISQKQKDANYSCSNIEIDKEKGLLDEDILYLKRMKSEKKNKNYKKINLGNENDILEKTNHQANFINPFVNKCKNDIIESTENIFNDIFSSNQENRDSGKLYFY